MQRKAVLGLLFIAAGAAAAVLAWRQFGASGPWADPDDPRLVALGQTVYAAHCADCHGADLEGQPDWRQRQADGTLPAPPHDDSGHTWHHPDDLLFTITKKGGQYLAPSDFKSGMPAFEDVLNDEEILASLAYIKSRWSPEVRARQAHLNKKG